MHSDRTRAALIDIAENIDLALHFVEGLDETSFCSDARSVYAVTRCLEIISEASRRLQDALKQRHPTIKWSDIAGAGNIYRHAYQNVAPLRVWETVQRALPPLREVIRAEMAAAPDPHS